MFWRVNVATDCGTAAMWDKTEGVWLVGFGDVLHGRVRCRLGGGGEVLFRTHASVSRRLLECVRMLRSCV